MEYIYATMLLHRIGKPVNEETLKKVLTAAGAKIDEARIKSLVAALEGVDIEKTIKEAAAMAPQAVAPAGGEKQAEKKEEKKEEKKVDEEKATAGLGALFG